MCVYLSTKAFLTLVIIFVEIHKFSIMRSFLLTLLSLFITTLSAQNAVNGFSFDEYTDIPVLKGGDSLINAWAGGLNFPHFSTLDLNDDGSQDLLVFDKTGVRVIPFLNTANSGTPKYEYAPQYRHAFPKGQSFYMLKDYNCDGKKDIFTGSSGNIVVYENTSSGGSLSFQKMHSTTYLEAVYPSSSTSAAISMTSADAPAIIDLDNDGDLDILAFLFGENALAWIENKQGCGLQMEFREKCWGHFEESGNTNEIIFNSCTPSKFKTNGALHAGSSVLALDLNADGVKEVLISDVSYPNVQALFNSGTTDSAYMSSKDTAFPSYDQPIDLKQFPAMFYEDVTGDQIKDLIAVTNENDFGTGFVSSDNILVYRNKGGDNQPDFELQENDFLRKTQLDVGEGCIPRIVDLNTDGLLDIVLANGFYREDINTQEPAFIYLQNTGTVQNPEFTVVDSDFANISSYSLGHSLTPAFADLDMDNDLDMIVGDANGKLHYFTNTGTLQNPAYTITTPEINGIDVGSYATPYLFDLDEDGDQDLIVGKSNGTLSYFKNQSASSPSFTKETDFFGGINVTRIASGFSVPYLFKYDGIINLMVSGEDGVFQYDSISSVSSGPTNLEKTVGQGSIPSQDSDETPFGTNKRSGRNQILIHASELRAAGLTAGKITALSFDITNISNLIERLNIGMKNVSFSDITNFDTPTIPVYSNERTAFSPGWTKITLENFFEWDGYSNLLIEICFRGNYVSTSNFPNIHLNMSTTSFFSNGYGDITNFDSLSKNGCVMPYQASIKKRPNVKVHLTPSFPRTSIVMSDGYRNAAAFGDLDQDGFIDALLGSYTGGVTLYKGRQYVIGNPEEKTVAKSFQVFPNPGKGDFAVAVQNRSKASLKVYDLTGRLVLEQDLVETETPVSLKSEPNGIYLFILQDSSAIETQKVILNR